MSILFGWCLILLLALPLGGFAAWHVALKAAAVSWPRTSGEILSSGLYRTAKSAQWCVQLKARYQVAGKSYALSRTSSSLVAGNGCDRDKRVIEARLERMQPGDRITVRYDPRAPDTGIVHVSAVLEFIDVFVGVVAMIWLAGGIALVRAGRALCSRPA